MATPTYPAGGMPPRPVGPKSRAIQRKLERKRAVRNRKPKTQANNQKRVSTKFAQM